MWSWVYICSKKKILKECLYFYFLLVQNDYDFIYVYKLLIMQGNILYRFPTLQRTASSQEKIWADCVGKMEKLLIEKKWIFRCFSFFFFFSKCFCHDNWSLSYNNMSKLFLAVKLAFWREQWSLDWEDLIYLGLLFLETC